MTEDASDLLARRQEMLEADRHTFSIRTRATLVRVLSQDVLRQFNAVIAHPVDCHRGRNRVAGLAVGLSRAALVPIDHREMQFPVAE